MNVSSTKKKVRERMRDRCAGLDAAWRCAQSARVQARLQAVDSFKTSQVVGLYAALPCEVDVTELTRRLWRAERSVCLPAFDPANAHYAMARVRETTALVEVAYGLREPADPEWIDPALLECMVVPGLAFDAAGHRIGHGGGYYDRLLAGLAAVKIGVAFDFQVLDTLPVEPHDVMMDLVVTPTRIWCDAGRRSAAAQRMQAV